MVCMSRTSGGTWLSVATSMRCAGARTLAGVLTLFNADAAKALPPMTALSTITLTVRAAVTCSSY